MSFAAIVALMFAIIFGRPSENTLLLFGILFLIGLSPVYLPLRPNSVESVLLKLPEDPDEQIAPMEGVRRPDRAGISFTRSPERHARSWDEWTTNDTINGERTNWRWRQKRPGGSWTVLRPGQSSNAYRGI
jgi:hypothetical protein